jgi:FixJ family two-component response regulator
MSDRGGVIAVVEDDAGMAKAIERLLRARGFVVEVFDSAEAFLASSSAMKASCLVVDVQLGGMSGIDLCRTLAASGSRLPFIFITALEDCELKKAAFELGGIAYLRKPFLSDLLVGAINKAGLKVSPTQF